MAETNITLSIHPDDVAKIAAIIFRPLQEQEQDVLPEVVGHPQVTTTHENTSIPKYISIDYLLSIIDNREVLQKICDAYNTAIENNIKFCKELNECKKE